jgi:inner membrane protein YidH
MNAPVTDLSTPSTQGLGALELALERTRVAYDNTLMATVRTATSLITFGFAIYKFFQLDLGRQTSDRLIGPREFALLMLMLGLLSLVAGVAEHLRNQRRLRLQWPNLPRSRGSIITAALVCILGILLLVAVIFRE